MPGQGAGGFTGYQPRGQQGHNLEWYSRDRTTGRYLSPSGTPRGCLWYQVYAFYLMTDHIHHSLAPGDSACLAANDETLAARRIAWRAVSGTLWESPSGVHRRLPTTACWYIELNATCSGMNRWTMWQPILVKIRLAGSADWLEGK